MEVSYELVIRMLQSPMDVGVVQETGGPIYGWGTRIPLQSIRRSIELLPSLQFVWV